MRPQCQKHYDDGTRRRYIPDCLALMDDSRASGRHGRRRRRHARIDASRFLASRSPHSIITTMQLFMPTRASQAKAVSPRAASLTPPRHFEYAPAIFGAAADMLWRCRHYFAAFQAITHTCQHDGRNCRMAACRRARGSNIGEHYLRQAERRVSQATMTKPF